MVREFIKCVAWFGWSLLILDACDYPWTTDIVWTSRDVLIYGTVVVLFVRHWAFRTLTRGARLAYQWDKYFGNEEFPIWTDDLNPDAT